MDPNANLQAQERIMEQINESGDSERRASLREDLRDLRSDPRYWLSNGGYAPNWDLCPLAKQAHKNAGMI